MCPNLYVHGLTCVSLLATAAELLASAPLEGGFRQLLDALPDTAIDAPKAPSIVSNINVLCILDASPDSIMFMWSTVSRSQKLPLTPRRPSHGRHLRAAPHSSLPAALAFGPELLQHCNVRPASMFQVIQLPTPRSPQLHLVRVLLRQSHLMHRWAA